MNQFKKDINRQALHLHMEVFKQFKPEEIINQKRGSKGDLIITCNDRKMIVECKTDYRSQQTGNICVELIGGIGRLDPNNMLDWIKFIDKPNETKGKSIGLINDPNIVLSFIFGDRCWVIGSHTLYQLFYKHYMNAEEKIGRLTCPSGKLPPNSINWLIPINWLENQKKNNFRIIQLKNENS